MYKYIQKYKNYAHQDHMHGSGSSSKNSWVIFLVKIVLFLSGCEVSVDIKDSIAINKCL